jgi:hypothetical protein
MSLDPAENETENTPTLPRLFLFEPGWRVARKSTSEREFCYTIAPGEDFYHRLLDGEIYLFKGDERVCLPCAGRRGLITFDPKGLRDPIQGVNVMIDALLEGFPVEVPDEGGEPA